MDGEHVDEEGLAALGLADCRSEDAVRMLTSARIEAAGLLFDMDGVLVDSSLCIRRAWHDWAPRHGIDAESTFDCGQGMTTADHVALVAPHLDAVAEAAEVEALEAAYADQVTPISGAAALVAGLGRSWAVVTSCTRDAAYARLESCGITPPDILVSAEDVSVGKPSPEGYLRGAALLGIDPADGVVVEDAPAGVLAAKRAGMRVLAVGSTHEHGELTAATWFVPSLAHAMVAIATEDARISLTLHSLQEHPLSTLYPSDPELLAEAVAGALVLHADDFGREASLPYWEWSRADVKDVADRALSCTDARVRDLSQSVLDAPLEPEGYRELVKVLTGCLSDGFEPYGELIEAAWRSECATRLQYHQGGDYRNGDRSIGWQEIANLSSPPTREDGATPDIDVVIPFRDTGQGHRLRNLLACLRALGDQSLDRNRYSVTVVENDTEPRWRRFIEPWSDHYLNIWRPGLFNKSWTVNVGVVHAADSAPLLCILDADVLADRHFLERNLTRFLRPGIGAHLPYRLMTCLDPGSSAKAIESRLFQGDAAASLDHLRGVHLRRPPGCCVWLRRRVFEEINGMDERFEGWGDEDNDFAFRVDLNAPFDIYDDVLLHLYHPSSSVAEAGLTKNHEVPPLSWPLDRAIGELGPGAAGLVPQER